MVCSLRRIEENIVAAAWVQRGSGKDGNPLASRLCFSRCCGTNARAFDGLLSEWDVPLAQMVIGKDAEVNLELLALAGFRKLVDLDYLSLENPQVDPNWSKRVLFFEPHAVNQAARLQTLLSAKLR